MRKSWKLWLAGIALVQLLVIGVDVALLWPSEAERGAALVRKGMTDSQVWEVLGEPCEGRFRLLPMTVKNVFHDECYCCLFDDGSYLYVSLNGSGERREEFRVTNVRTQQPLPAPPLTRLRRTLARIFPALKE